MNDVCYDQDWFDELCTLKISFHRQLHNNVKGIREINSDRDIDTLYSYPNLKHSNESLLLHLSNLLLKIESDQKRPTLVKELWIKKLRELQSVATILKIVQDAKLDSKYDGLHLLDFHFSRVWGEYDSELFALTLAEAAVRLTKREASFFVDNNIILPSNDFEYYVSKYQRSTFCRTLDQHSYKNQHVALDDFKSMLEDTLLRLQIFDWKVKFDTKNKFGRFVVLSKVKSILLPVTVNGKSYISYKRAIKLIHHEIYTHVVRTNAGYRSRLKLLSIGLAGYQHAEEGIATYNEQKAVGSNKYYAGFLSYLAIGLAKGLDRGSVQRLPYEFNTLFTNVFLALGLTSQQAYHKALQTTLHIYIKVGDSYFVNTSDVIYRSGNIKIHSLISTDPLAENYFTQGKFDPGDQFLVQGLTSLGIIRHTNDFNL